MDEGPWAWEGLHLGQPPGSCLRDECGLGAPPGKVGRAALGDIWGAGEPGSAQGEVFGATAPERPPSILSSLTLLVPSLLAPGLGATAPWSRYSNRRPHPVSARPFQLLRRCVLGGTAGGRLGAGRGLGETAPSALRPRHVGGPLDVCHAPADQVALGRDFSGGGGTDSAVPRASLCSLIGLRGPT